jgi:formylglycine-generating enzyme required for sulfatase activity
MIRFVLIMLLSWLAISTSTAQATYQELAQSVGAPGVVFVKDSLFLDEAEVANIHWLEYLHFIRKDSSEAFYRSQVPDTLALVSYMQAHYGSAGKYLPHYLTYPGFRYFPVVGISQAQAANYCRWRSAMVNKLVHSEEYLRKHPKLRHYNFRVEYRLPTMAEWETAAAGRLNPLEQPLGVVRPPLPGSKQYKAQLAKPAHVALCQGAAPTLQPSQPVFAMEFTVRENFYVGPTGQALACPLPPNYVKKGSLNEGVPIMDYTYVNPPNAYGLYNMIGNVAELTATPGVARGGSFEQSINDFTLRTNFSYAAPTEWLGFRCACTVFISPKS